ncbi:MAG: type II toxin-antitoxin system MqsA family antitoxin [Methylomonas sp.]
MNCIICKNGKMRPGETTVTLNRNSSLVIVKQTPADVCDNCGEYYLSEAVTASILALAEDALRKGAEIEILCWAA